MSGHGWKYRKHPAINAYSIVGGHDYLSLEKSRFVNRCYLHFPYVHLEPWRYGIAIVESHPVTPGAVSFPVTSRNWAAEDSRARFHRLPQDGFVFGLFVTHRSIS